MRGQNLMSANAIISIRPKFAEAILTGSKSVELRRRIPALDIDTRLWIYATRPTAAIIGSVIVANVFRASPAWIWRKYSSQTAITRREFDIYFEGATEAIAICLQKAVRTRQVDIALLRDVWCGFHPPQVLSHLDPTDARKLSKLADAQL